MPELKATPIAARAAECPFDPAPELRAMLRDDELPRIKVPSPLLGEFEAVAVTRFEDVRSLLGDDRLLTGQSLPTQPGNLLSYDGPEHARLRRMLTGFFTTKRARALRPMIDDVVAARLDALAAAGPGADLVQAFCAPIPTQVICELLGVPYADREDFRHRAEVALDMNSSREEQLQKAADMQAYMGGLVARHRDEPGDNLLGDIVREHGHELTDIELVGIGNMLLIAGHETITSMLAVGIALLLQHPDQLAIVRDDPTAVDGAVEELLRYCTPATILPRQAAAPICLRGQEISEGERVVVSILAANRDPRTTGRDLDRLDVRRPPQPHMAFGHGPHQCLGQQLARTQLRVALPALFTRFPTLRLAVPAAEVDYKTTALVFGVKTLPVAW